MVHIIESAIRKLFSRRYHFILRTCVFLFSLAPYQPAVAGGIVCQNISPTPDAFCAVHYRLPTYATNQSIILSPSSPPAFQIHVLNFDCEVYYLYPTPGWVVDGFRWSCGCSAANNQEDMTGSGSCTPRCPAGTIFADSGGQAGHCIAPALPAQPKSAGSPPCRNCVGDPINAGSGNGYQIEQDYRAANGELMLQRTYNSDGLPRPTHFGLGWTNNYDRKIQIIPNSSPAVASAMRPDGKVYFFTLTGGAWVPDADVADKLIQLTNNSGNATGWRYSDATDDSVETYDINGNWLQRTTRNQITQTLTYSDGTTGTNGGYIVDAVGNATTQPLPAGLLIRAIDSFGRQLRFSYNSSSQIVTTVDPTGAAYLYRYTNDPYQFLESVTFPDGHTRKYLYNEAANAPNSPYARPTLTGIIDENGNRFATFKYDSMNRAISSEHDLPPVNGVPVPVDKLSIAYTTNNGLIASAAVTDALGTAHNYSFTTLLNVTKNTGISQPCSAGCGSNSTRANAATYDTNSNVSSRTDFNNYKTTYSYDLTRNLETARTEGLTGSGATTPQTRTITTVWHPTYRLPTLITEPGKTSAFTYDTSGNLLTKTITDTALNQSRTWTWTYNTLGQVLTADGPRTDVADITTYTYYPSASTVAGSEHAIGDLATVTNAAGQVTAITRYNGNGQPLSLTDPNGIVTTLTYDARGRLLTRTVNGVQTTTYTYDGVGQLTRVALPDASYLNYTYDTAHRLTDIADNAGNTIHYSLDAMGNRTAESTYDPGSVLMKTRSRVFDALNRLQKDIGGTSPATQITQYGYDHNGNLTSVTDPNNHVTTNGYDALNRLVQITDPNLGVSHNGYNALDQLTSVTDPRAVVTNYTVNALGDTTQTQSPDSGTTNNQYDAAGNIIQKTDARGVVANYTYDALNRVTAISYPGNTAENVSFTYDSTANGNKGSGHLTGYSNDGGATVLVYDSYGNVIQQTDMIGSQINVTAYQYDSANRLAQITYPSGRIVTYTRNALGQITQVQTQNTGAANAVTIASGITHKPLGPLSGITFGNNVATTLLYDADYRVARMTTTSTPQRDFTYSYDAAGNITQLTDQVGAATFSKTLSYDGLDRLTGDTNDTGQWSYSYDANGNRTGRTWVHTDTSTTTLNPAIAATSNRMTQLGSSPVTADNAGNITTIGSTTTYGYNQANRLNNVTRNSASASLIYNAIGQRVQLQGTTTRQFTYARNGQLLAMTTVNSDGSLAQNYEYLWLDDTPIAQVATTYSSNNTVTAVRTTYIHADHLNTPRAMTDSTRAIVWRWEGDAFGTSAPNTDPDGDGINDTLALRFPGQIADAETDFYYNGYRDYDPSAGRYVESDPIGVAGGLNTYAYVDSNPIRFIDPQGLSPFGPTGGRGGKVNSNQCGNEKQCDTQYYDVDIPTCRAIAKKRGADAGRRCYASAATRYSACLNGEPIPDLDTYNWRENTGPIFPSPPPADPAPIPTPWWILLPLIIILAPVGA